MHIETFKMYIQRTITADTQLNSLSKYYSFSSTSTDNDYMYVLLIHFVCICWYLVSLCFQDFLCGVLEMCIWKKYSFKQTLIAICKATQVALRFHCSLFIFRDYNKLIIVHHNHPDNIMTSSVVEVQRLMSACCVQCVGYFICVTEVRENDSCLSLLGTEWAIVLSVAAHYRRAQLDTRRKSLCLEDAMTNNGFTGREKTRLG